MNVCMRVCPLCKREMAGGAWEGPLPTLKSGDQPIVLASDRAHGKDGMCVKCGVVHLEVAQHIDLPEKGLLSSEFVCPSCAKKMVRGVCDDFLPLFRVGSEERVLMTAIGSARRLQKQTRPVCDICPKCGFVLMQNVIMRVVRGEESEIRELVQHEARAEEQLLGSLKYGAIIGAIIGGGFLAWLSRGGEGGVPAMFVLTTVGAIGGAFAGALSGSVIFRASLK